MSAVLLLVAAMALGIPVALAVAAIGGVAYARPGLTAGWPAWVGVPGAVAVAGALIGLLPGVIGMVAFGAGAFGGLHGPLAKDIPTLLGLIAVGGASNGTIAAVAYLAVAAAGSFLPALQARAPWLRGSLGPAALLAAAGVGLTGCLILAMRVLSTMD